MEGFQIVQRAKEQLAQLTGLEPDTVSSLDRSDDGWSVTVVMVELKRIPDGSDVLASYETTLDDDGNLVRYKRAQRYLRDQLIDDA